MQINCTRVVTTTIWSHSSSRCTHPTAGGKSHWCPTVWAVPWLSSSLTTSSPSNGRTLTSTLSFRSPGRGRAVTRSCSPRYRGNYHPRWPPWSSRCAISLQISCSNFAVLCVRRKACRGFSPSPPCGGIPFWSPRPNAATPQTTTKRYSRIWDSPKDLKCTQESVSLTRGSPHRTFPYTASMEPTSKLRRALYTTKGFLTRSRHA